MNDFRPELRAGPIECDALKASLSAYLDDELTREERLRADAHLVSCGSCRTLVERAESLDGQLRAKLAEDVAEASEALASSPTDIAAFESRVLAAIGHEHRRTWVPRLAAAAAVAVAAAGGWWLWNSRETPESLAPAGPGTFVRGGETAPRAIGPVRAPDQRAVRLAALTDEDRQALYATSLILDNARRTAFADETRRTELRETVRYDELVDRLEEVAEKLPPDEQQTVALAREVTARIAEASDDPRAWVEIQQDVERRGLAPSIEMMSESR
jgi:phenylpyruvate tautomerase PptA (4-oxalocrotonate tautomerase family)